MTTMKTNRWMPHVLMLLSGFSALVFQLLWMRQLALLFGNTAHATSMTLAVFFLGLALGSWFWGRRSATIHNPMRSFAALQLGVALTALAQFAVLPLFRTLYPVLYQNTALQPLRFALKCLLAMILILPPASCMGGTLPMMGQALINSRRTFGSKAAGLYAINTTGAALGALAAGFFLIRLIGYSWTCIVAIGVVCASAALAFRMAAGPDFAGRVQQTGFTDAPPVRKRVDTVALYAVCFLSGFAFLALEVVWTHLLAQIHTNSIYSFSVVLIIVLFALGLGAATAAALAKRCAEPSRVLAILLLLGGLAVAVSPFVFMEATNGFQMLNTGGTFLQFMQALFLKGAAILGLPAFFLAIIFPFMMKMEERFSAQPGQSLGRLSAVDTLGAISGALLCGFVFLELFGLWRTVQLVGALYLVAAILLPTGVAKAAIAVRVGGACALVILFTWLSPADLRVTGWDPSRPPEQLLDLWETPHGTVSVVRNQESGLVIKLNANYWLGSTGAAWQQHFQGRIPLLVYPRTRSVFFLGMGTGISAGGALDPRFTQMSRVVACEIVPEVVVAARKYMTGESGIAGIPPVDFTSGLFTDPRVEIVVEDGRQHLMASGDSFDMINADLFLPYRRGTGSLYSREHFQNVRNSLHPGGVFVQWLPMFQITEFEFGVIARTMLEVFDHVTLWRNNFSPGREAVALIGHTTADPLPAAPSETVGARRSEVDGKDPLRLDRLDISFNEETVLVFYCGNITASRDRFQQYPLNTDDRPVIEYSAPLSIRRRGEGIAPTLVGPRFVELIDELLERCPPDVDPMLVNRSAANRRLVSAGAELHRFWLEKAMDNRRNAVASWSRFVREWTDR